MSYKDLGKKNLPPRVETPEEADLRARAAARHRAKEAKAARSHEHQGGKEQPQQPGGAARREPTE